MNIIILKNYFILLLINNNDNTMDFIQENRHYREFFNILNTQKPVNK